MTTNFLQFTKLQKTNQLMEKQLNEILAKGSFKFASQSESHGSGKITYSIFIDEASESKTKAKVFKSKDMGEIENEINKFVSQDCKMKLFTMTCVNNTIIGTIFFE